MNIKTLVTPLLASALLLGCGGDPPDEADVDVTRAAWSEASCTTTDYDIRVVGGVDPAYVSPQTYDNPGCNKSIVVNLSNYSSTYAGHLGEPALDGHTRIDWAGGAVGTQTACNNLWMGAILYGRSGGAWVEQKRVEARGSWSPLGGGFFCRTPAIGFHTVAHPAIGQTVDLVPPKDYRFAISARTNNTTSASTRAFRMQSFPPEPPPR